MKQAVCTAMLSFLGISILLARFGLLFGREIMIALDTPSDVLDSAVLYLNIYFYGLPFLFMYNILSSYTAQNIGANKKERISQGYQQI